MADPLSIVQQPQPGQIGFGLPAELNAPLPADPFAAELRKEKRQKATSVGDVVQSIWRQDGITDGLVADIAGRELTPDPNYNVFKDPTWPELVNGVHDDFIPELYKAHSAAHALYIKDRLLQKQTDLQRLDDLGVAGNVGRFALNAILPDQLLIAMSGGWAARGVSAFQRGRMVRNLEGLAKAEVTAGADAAAAVRATSPTAVAAGVGLAAAENAAYEKLRQSVNFEDSNLAVLEAGLLGAAISAPFAWAGARSMRRVADVAQREHETLTILRKADEGQPLTPEEGQRVLAMSKELDRVRDFETGKITEEEWLKPSNELMGPFEPVDRWMKRYGDRIQAEAKTIIDEFFPVDPNFKAPKPTSAEELAKIDARIARADEAAKPKPVEAPVATLAELATPGPKVESQMASKLRAALTERTKRNEEGRKQADLLALDVTRERNVAAERKANFEAAEKAEAQQRDRDFESMINERELAIADDGFQVSGNEKDPGAAVSENTPAPVVLEKAESTYNPAESFVGKHVSWLDAKTGDMMAGKVMRVSPNGKLVIENELGELKSVAHTDIDQFETQDAPAGFLKGSVGSAQREHLEHIADARSAFNEDLFTVPGTDIKVNARWDIFAVLNRSQSKEVRRLGFKLVKDAIQVNKDEAQSWTASEWRTHLIRTIGGEFHVTASQAAREARAAAKIAPWNVAQFDAEFFSRVSRLTRGDDTALQGLDKTVAGLVQRTSAAQKKAYGAYLKEAQKVYVKGAMGVPENEAYVNRVWRPDRIRAAIELHGEKAVHQLIADAMTGSNSKGPLTGDVVKARRFLNIVRSLEFSDAMQSVHLAGRDMNTLRTELESRGMTRSQIDDVVDIMFEAKESSGSDAGQAAQLKYRFDLDESLIHTTDKGQLRISDLLENDARVLMDTYGASMAGHTGMAKVGFDSINTFQAALKRVEEEALADASIDGQRLAKEVTLLKDVQRQITGRPMSTQDFSYTNRVATALRGYTRSVMLGQLGIAAAFEMKQAIALMGFRSLYTQMPSFRGFITALRQGHLPSAGLARDVMQIGGWGHEKARAYARAHELENGFAGRSITLLEQGANKASHAVDIISGNASFTSITRQISAMMAVQRLHDHAVGRKALTDKNMERLVGQGIDKAELQSVLKDLKEFSVEANDRLQQIRYEDWKAAEPETYEKFQLYLSRQVRDAIQDQDLGETMPFMHTTLGKVFSELKTFFLVSHAKNFLKNLHYRDATALQVWLIGFVGESLAYSMQTAINHPGDTDRLTPENIARAAFFRMSAAGMSSLMVESGYSLLTGGDSLVSPGMTTNTDNRSFLKTPSMIVLGRAMNLPSTTAGALLGTDVTTKSEVKDALTSLPGSNTYLLRPMVEWFSNSFPNSDPTKSQ